MGYPLSGASDHGTSLAIYVSDPDNNGVELYWDKPRELWPFRKDGSIDIYNESLNIPDLLESIHD